MTPLPRQIAHFLAAALAVSLLAAPPVTAANGKKKGKLPEATAVSGAPVTLAGKYAAGTAIAKCPKGTIAVAGGFASSIPNPVDNAGGDWVNVYESQRAGQRAWRVSGVQYFGASGSLTSFAQCERLKIKVKTRSARVALGDVNTTATALAACPRRTKLLGGGFMVPPSTATGSSYVSRSIAGNGVGWVVDATRFTGADAAGVTAFGYCADVGKIKTRGGSTAILGSGITGVAVSPKCPRKTKLRGGGFATSTPVDGIAGSALVYETRPAYDLGPKTGVWLSAAYPGGAATASTLVSNAYCR